MIRFGLAWLPSERFVLTTEALYHDGVDNSDPEFALLNLQPTTNLSGGCEVKIRFVAVRFGGFSDQAMTRRPSMFGINQPTHIDYLGTSAGFGIESKQFDLGLTIVRRSGTGKSQIIGGRQEVQNVKAASESVFLGGRYSL